MSAQIELSTLPIREVLKPTGFIPPAELADKTFAEIAESGVPGKLFAWKSSGDALVYTFKETPKEDDKVILADSGAVTADTVTAYTEADGITVDSVVYARYTTGDVALA